MAWVEDSLIDWRDEIQESIFEHNNNSLPLGWLFMIGWAFILATSASYMTITIGPGANS